MRRAPFRHIGLKILSLGLAVLLWYLVAGQTEAERSMRVPLEFQNMPEQLEIVGEPPSLVDVRLRGASGTLGQLRGGDLVALLDLGSARPGRRLFHLTPQSINTPAGVRVLQVLPATVSLSFEKSASRIVPVMPPLEGEPASGHVVGRITSSPATVEVLGPQSVISQLTEATTEPVSVRGATTTVTDRVTVGVNDPSVRLRTPRSATITVEILPAPIERTIREVPVILRSLVRGRSASLTPKGVAITVRGTGSVVQSLRPASVPVFVDLSGLRPGQYNLPVRVDPTEQYTVAAIQPASVRVRIK